MADVLTPEMLQSMNHDPIVFALANPSPPEISYDLAMSSRKDIIFATGRSDYPNQINNVLGFPYIFRGALDVQAKCINEEMKIATVYALAELTKSGSRRGKCCLQHKTASLRKRLHYSKTTRSAVIDNSGTGSGKSCHCIGCCT